MKQDRVGWESVDSVFFFFFQAEDGIRDLYVTGVQTCALPISEFEIDVQQLRLYRHREQTAHVLGYLAEAGPQDRSEEHTSELQSRRDLVCRLLLEKKKKKKKQKI